MADDTATPKVDPAATAAPSPSADPAPAPSGDSAAPVKTLLTSGDAPADPAKPAEPAKTEPATATVPEKYDFAALKLPEGVQLNPEIVGAVEPVLKELGLSQEGANKLITAHAEALAKAEKAAETQRETDFKTYMTDTAKKHVEAVQKEWGADYQANLQIAQRGIARFVSNDMKALLDETGLGNHPEFLKAFLGIGKMIQEDMPLNGGSGSAFKKSNEEIFYGTSH